MLSQELMTNPSKALQKAFQEMVGMPIESFKTKMERVEAFDRAQTVEQVGKDFCAQTPDYLPNPKNGKKMTDYCNTYKLPITLESLVQAYNELSEMGLLEVKTETPVATPQAQTVAPQARRGSGLSTKGAAQVPAPKELTVEEMYAMPMDKFLALGNAIR